MLIKKPHAWQMAENEVTSEAHYKNRRQFLRAMGIAATGSVAVTGFPGMALGLTAKAKAVRDLDYKTTEYDPGEDQTSFQAVTSYNNFYEFGTAKSDPADYAHEMTTDPWSITVEGHCGNGGQFALEDVIDFSSLEERIYRHRCVEAWSMVIPWLGVPLASVLQKFGPTAEAKYVQFETYANRDEMWGLSRPVLNWPYVEGLRMDEAMHPLAFMSVGLYGKELLNQNGAPLRLVVPWKYGFKGIKSIIAIRFVSDMPRTSWNESNAREYGFYSNVNPSVQHPRWSQSTERRIGEFFRRDTLMFNGYEEEVASLYRGMDLSRYF